MFVTKEIVEAAKIKAEQTYEGLNVIDPGILPFAKLVNSLPGIAVVWSCEGHFEDTELRTYVTCIVTEAGLKNLNTVRNIMLRYIGQEPSSGLHKVDLELTVFTLQYHVDENTYMDLPHWRLGYQHVRHELQYTSPQTLFNCIKYNALVWFERSAAAVKTLKKSELNEILNPNPTMGEKK